jgi:hypothetical protein
MDFQIASDLHLEFRGVDTAPASAFPKRRAPLLLLAGDVCPAAEPGYADVLAEVAEPFEAVLYIPGNHEYYGFDGSIAQADAFMERTCYSRMRNVIFMNRRRVDIAGFAYIGATLWTNCPADASMLNDFSHIDGGDFTPAKMNAMHRDHRDWIKNAVKQAKRDGMMGAVVISHHAPDKMLATYGGGLGMAGARSRGAMLPYYYASDMAEVARDPFIQVWAHGHSHESYRMQPRRNGTIYASNALGYPGERTGYSNGGAVLRLQ